MICKVAAEETLSVLFNLISISAQIFVEHFECGSKNSGVFESVARHAGTVTFWWPRALLTRGCLQLRHADDCFFTTKPLNKLMKSTILR